MEKPLKNIYSSVLAQDPLPEENDQKQTYEFVGYHLIASYLECNNEALHNKTALVATMIEAVQLSGATVLNVTEHVFASGGFTALILLAESHASIHTYPENSACFIDLFTCGHSCDAKKFEVLMERYLHPKKIYRQLLVRN